LLLPEPPAFDGDFFVSMREQNMGQRLIRLRELQARLGGVSRTTLWRWERNSDFPTRVQIGPNTVAWIESEIEEWLAGRVNRLNGHAHDR
jgi:prophage regulatory protein